MNSEEPSTPSPEGAIEPPVVPGPAAGGAEPRQSFLDRLIGVVMSPAETFARIAKSPDWLVPLLLLTITGFGVAWLSYAQIPPADIEREVRTRMERTFERFGAQPPEAQVEEIVSKEAGKTPLRRSLPRLAFAIFPVIGALYYFLVFKAFGSTATFRQAFSYFLWGSIPTLAKTLLMAPIVLFRSDLSLMDVEFQTIVRTSVASFVDPTGHAFLWGMLLTLDVFVVWTVYLRIVGGKQLPGVSTGVATGATVFAWIFTAALAGVGAMFAF